MVVGDTRSGAETPTFSPSKMVFTVQTHVTEPFNMEAISRKAAGIEDDYTLQKEAAAVAREMAKAERAAASADAAQSAAAARLREREAKEAAKVAAAKAKAEREAAEKAYKEEMEKREAERKKIEEERKAMAEADAKARALFKAEYSPPDKAGKRKPILKEIKKMAPPDNSDERVQLVQWLNVSSGRNAPYVPTPGRPMSPSVAAGAPDRLEFVEKIVSSILPCLRAVRCLPVS